MSKPSSSDGREESSKTITKVSWVEEARQEALKQEAFRSNMPCNKICFDDRGSNQSGGLECSCGSGSSARGRATSSMGDRDNSR
jgi:hypothetical protein